MRRFATCCGVQLCGGASIPRLVCVSWLFRVFMSVMCPFALASRKETLVRARVCLGGSTRYVTSALSKGAMVLIVLCLASVAPSHPASPRNGPLVTRVTASPVVCMLPVTGRASVGNVTHALWSHGPAVLLSPRVPGLGGGTGSASSFRLVRLRSPGGPAPGVAAAVLGVLFLPG